MTLWTVLNLFIALALLLVGAELFVRSASSLSERMGIPPLIVGLTVVAVGTSAPELLVSLFAGLRGQPDIAAANVAGSNIFNILFILGASALITPLAVSLRLVRFEVPVLAGATVCLMLFARDGRVAGWEGPMLLLLFVLFTGALIAEARRGIAAGAVSAGPDGPEGSRGFSPRLLLGLAAGLALLLIGSHWLVSGAAAVAAALGVSERVIGLTIIAAGTSLPELATSVLAAIRKERDIAVGNVVGSNIFNVVAVLGVAATFTPGGLAIAEPIRRFDLPVSLFAALLCLPIFITGRRVSRAEGLLFLFLFLGYMTLLLLRS